MILDAGDSGHVTVWVGTAQRRQVGETQVEYLSWPGFNLTTADQAPGPAWIRVPQLVPISSTRGPNGTALFDLKRQINDNDLTIDQASIPSSNSVVKERAWIAICADSELENCNPSNPSSIKWFGRIQTIERNYLPQENSVSGSQDYTGTVSAVGPEIVLQSVYSHAGLIRLKAGSELVDIIEPKPTYNIDLQGTIAGNFEETSNGQGVFLGDINQFTRTKIGDSGEGTAHAWDDPSRAWTRHRVLLHELSSIKLTTGSNPTAFEIPSLTLRGEEGAQGAHSKEIVNRVLKDETPRMWNLRGLSVRQVLDRILPRSEGLGWKILITSDAGWDIVPYSLNDSILPLPGNSGEISSLPANPPITIDSTALPVKEIKVARHDVQDSFDRVLVRGNRIVAAGVVQGPRFHPDAKGGAGDTNSTTQADFRFTNMVAEWREEGYEPKAEVGFLENEYLLGGNLTAEDNKAEKSDRFRSDTRFQDVFQRFRVLDGSVGKTEQTSGEGGSETETFSYSWDGIFRSVENAGELAEPVYRAWCPMFTWAPASASLTWEQSLGGESPVHSSPYVTDAKILDYIPMQPGWHSPDKTIDQDRWELTTPQQAYTDWLPPQIYHLLGTSVNNPNVGLFLNLNNVGGDFPVPSFQTLPGRASFRLKSTNPLYQALTEYQQMIDIDDGEVPTARSPLDIANPLDWRSMVVVMAMPCAQRVTGEMIHPRLVGKPGGISAITDEDIEIGRTQATRTLIVEDNSLHCHFINKGVPLGVDNENGNRLIRLSDDTLTRNDFVTAQRRANEIALFTFRDRSILNLTIGRPDLMPGYDESGAGATPATGVYSWCYQGAMISEVKDEIQILNINSIIEDIEVRWTPDDYSLVVRTQPPPQLTFGGHLTGGAGSAPTVPSLGTTMERSVLDTRNRLQEIEFRVERLPITQGRTINSPTTDTLLYIEGTNDITPFGLPDGTYLGLLEGRRKPSEPETSRITSVPTKVPDPADTSYEPGLAVGRIGGFSGTPVWVANRVTDAEGEIRNGELLRTVPGRKPAGSGGFEKGSVVLSRQTAQLPIDDEDEETATVYLVDAW